MSNLKYTPEYKPEMKEWDIDTKTGMKHTDSSWGTMQPSSRRSLILDFPWLTENCV